MSWGRVSISCLVNCLSDVIAAHKLQSMVIISSENAIVCSYILDGELDIALQEVLRAVTTMYYLHGALALLKAINLILYAYLSPTMRRRKLNTVTN